ncbi:hypothetical protein ANN_23457 [Periplaneta americana]|uniref:Uncharacterized protein n=1 Tax=Periplaneta americana TaxID=6978 RepID=A0ABQ8SMD8_PERAM|nr:hypothetical protein ANN_23457 [Periplaneta americana]
MDLREVEYDGRDWFDLAQYKDRWRVYVRAVMNLRVNTDKMSRNDPAKLPNGAGVQQKCARLSVLHPNPLLPVPKREKTDSAEILTSSPYKNQLAEEREDKGAKDKTKNNKQSTIKGVRRNIMKNNHIETKKQQQKTTKVALREETSSEEGSDNDDAECIFCKDS